jgi:hypothetical protein
MPHVYLPADHTDADLVLAGQVAELMESVELYVAWTPTAGPAAPDVPALMREPVGAWTQLFGVLRALGEVCLAAVGRRASRTAHAAPGLTAGPDAAQPRSAA